MGKTRHPFGDMAHFPKCSNLRTQQRCQCSLLTESCPDTYRQWRCTSIQPRTRYVSLDRLRALHRLDPRLQVVDGICPAFTPTCNGGTITSADVLYVHEIDHSPSAEEYDRWSSGCLSPHMHSGEDVTATVMDANVLANPLGILVGEDEDNEPLYVPEPVIACTQNGSIVTMGRIRQGAEVAHLTCQKKHMWLRILRTVKEQMRKGEFEPKSVFGSLFNTCLMNIGSMGDDLHLISEKMSQTLGHPSIPYLGVFAGVRSFWWLCAYVASSQAGHTI